MKASANHNIECRHLPVFSSQSKDWENILVEQFHHPAGEGSSCYSDAHSICLSLAPRPVHLLQTQGDKTHTGFYIKGCFCITPAQMPFFARWESDDRFMQIRIAAQFLQTIAVETIDANPDRLEIIPQPRMRDPQLEAIAMMLLTELQQEGSSSKLYIESLTNILAVHLLRQYATAKSDVPIYQGGLAQRQVVQVLDYINDHLDHEIKLADLAALLGMSQFHFSHLFKQTIGITPYQYLLQQRIERAKQLLKQTDQSITEIAFQCGFNSHSHLSKQFRQLVGISPRNYRAD